MESNSVCYQKSDNQVETTAQWESDLFTTRIITDRIARHEVLLPINHKNSVHFPRKDEWPSYVREGKFTLKKLTKETKTL